MLAVMSSMPSHHRRADNTSAVSSSWQRARATEGRWPRSSIESPPAGEEQAACRQLQLAVIVSQVVLKIESSNDSDTL